MSGFEPLLDEEKAASVRVAPDQSDFLRNAPLLKPEIAATLGSRSRGDAVADQDLGRSLMSTPRLASVSAKSWLPESSIDDVDDEAANTDDNFIDEYKAKAGRAVFAGMGMGNKAEQYRQKFANIRKKRSGGIFNYKNWGWVRKLRERKLRSQIANEFPGARRQAPAQQAPAQQAPAQQAPALEQKVSAPEPVRGAEPNHRQPKALKSALKVSGGREHTPDTMLPATAAAKQGIDDALEKEAQASEPFVAGGKHAGVIDVALKGGQPKITQKNQAANVINSMGFFAPPSKLDLREKIDSEGYADAMSASTAAEKKGRAQDALQNWEDQGDLKAPIHPDDATIGRTDFFNGYWNAEMANPKPTRQAKTGKRVRFDESAEQEPEENRDPQRKFAVEQASHLQGKMKRKAALKKQVDSFRAKNAEDLKGYSEWGARTHAKSPMLAAPQVPASDDLPLIEEEEKDANYWNS